MWEEELRLSTRGWSLIEGQFHGAKMKINVEETVWVIGYLNLRSDRDRYIRKGVTTIIGFKAQSQRPI